VADTKISALTALTGANVADGDLLVAVDVSDTTMAASGTDKKVAISDLVAALQAARNLPVHVHRTSDFASTDNVNLADVTNMAFSMLASATYAIEYNIFTVSAATTTGLVLGLNAAAAATYVRYATYTPTSGTATFYGGATAYNTAIVATGTKSTTEPSLVVMRAYVVNGGSDTTLQLRMRTEVSGSAATIQRGSWGRCTRLA
jgi:hypothetical protein